MRLAYRIFLIIGVFVLPLACTTLYFVIVGNNKDIDVADTEKAGNQFQRPLENALEHLVQSQALAQLYAGGDKSVRKPLDDIKAAINQDFSDVLEQERLNGVKLEFTDAGLAKRKREKFRASTIKAEWDALSKDMDGLSAKDSNARHLALASDINTMVTHAGDTSNLILDPELDTYYLISATLNDLPGQHMRFMSITSNVLEMLQRKTLTPQDRKQLAVSSSFLTDNDRDNTVSHLDTALDQHVYYYSGMRASFKNNVSPKLTDFVTTTNALAEMLDKLADSEKPEIDLDPKTYLATSRKAEEASFALWHSSINELDGLLQRRIDSHVEQRQHAFEITGFFLLLAAILSLVMIRALTRSIEAVSGELHELAAGEADLTRRISVVGSYELQRLANGFNTLMSKLLELIKQVQQSGAQVTSSSNEIAASTKQLEAAVTEQAASTNEVVATTKQISATSQTLAHTMNEVGKVAGETAGLAGSVQNGLEGMGNTMRHLADATGSISNKLSTISDKANNINKIVVTITKVADQTNLLSLNASIEAEKAGEHGLGFAVVAREIRRLADQTAVATLDIERMVKEMHSAVSTGVMEMDKFTRDVGQGVEEINQIGVQLADIIDRVQTLAPRFEIVSEGMSAQSQGAAQISVAMVQLSEAARQTMDSLRQTNGAILELNSAARGLHVEVSRFGTKAG